jgi:phospholipase C
VVPPSSGACEDGTMTGQTRRNFLAGAAAAGAAAFLAACSDSGKGAAASTSPRTTATTPTTTIPPTTAPPTTALPTTTGSTTIAGGSINDVEHVVIFFQENRSFDHYFGARRGVTGFGDSIPGPMQPFHFDTATTAAACSTDPDHSWAGQHAAWNGGANDGFATRMGPMSMGYFTRADLPYYWALADEYTLCDHSFSSVLGPTTPNRLYSMSATIDPQGAGGGPVTSNLNGPFTWTTYPERLQAAGVSWRVYHEADDYDDNPLKFFASFQNLADTDPLFDAAMRNRSADAFVTDVAKGDIPQVSWIVAPAAKSEHPSWAPAVGEDLTATILAALMANPEVWKKTVFILSYDENGGFFDHVAPPVPPKGTADEFIGDEPIGLGFRVPTLVVSPWSRGGGVCSDVFDHTSTLRFLEQRFGVEVPNLSAWRRSTCGDITTALDFSSFDASVPSLPSTAERMQQVLAGCADLPQPVVPVRQTPPTTELA